MQHKVDCGTDRKERESVGSPWPDKSTHREQRKNRYENI